MGCHLQWLSCSGQRSAAELGVSLDFQNPLRRGKNTNCVHSRISVLMSFYYWVEAEMCENSTPVAFSSPSFDKQNLLVVINRVLSSHSFSVYHSEWDLSNTNVTPCFFSQSLPCCSLVSPFVKTLKKLFPSSFTHAKLLIRCGIHVKRRVIKMLTGIILVRGSFLGKKHPL